MTPGAGPIFTPEDVLDKICRSLLEDATYQISEL